MNKHTIPATRPPITIGQPKSEKERRAIDIYHTFCNNPYVDHKKLLMWVLNELGLAYLMRGYKGDASLDEILGVGTDGTE